MSDYDNTGTTPLLVLEADVSLYIADDAGNPAAGAWLGGPAETLALADEMVERIVQRPGDPFEDAYHENERHTIEIKNLWLHNAGGDTPVMPRIGRNQLYVLVIVWWDPERRVWNKRAYYGVRARTQRVEGDAYQNVVFRAQQMFEWTGLGLKPSSVAGKYGTLRFVSGRSSTTIYRYDFDTAEYTILDETYASMAAFDLSTPGQCSVSVDGTVAMIATATEVQINELEALGATFPQTDTSVRLEWWVGATRVASLTKNGTLAVVDVNEAVEPPALPTQFKLLNGDTWLFSIASGGLYAPSYTVPIPPP